MQGTWQITQSPCIMFPYLVLETHRTAEALRTGPRPARSSKNAAGTSRKPHLANDPVALLVGLLLQGLDHLGLLLAREARKQGHAVEEHLGLVFHHHLPDVVPAPQQRWVLLLAACVQPARRSGMRTRAWHGACTPAALDAAACCLCAASQKVWDADQALTWCLLPSSLQRSRSLCRFIQPARPGQGPSPGAAPAALGAFLLPRLLHAASQEETSPLVPGQGPSLQAGKSAHDSGTATSWHQAWVAVTLKLHNDTLERAEQCPEHIPEAPEHSRWTNILATLTVACKRSAT